MARKADKEKLTSGELSKEFFGDGSSAAPGQNEANDDGTTNLFHAIVSSKLEPEQEDDSYSLFNERKGSSTDFGPDYSKRSWLSLGGGDNPEVNPYAAEQDKRYAMDKRAAKIIRLIVLLIIAYLVCAIILPSPAYNLNFAYTFQAFMTCIQDNFVSLATLFDKANNGAQLYKLCTYAIVALAGAALATTGAVYQGALKNALVSPTTLGVNAGGTLGVTVFVLLASVDSLNPITGLNKMSITNIDAVSAYYDALSFTEYLFISQGRAFASIVGCFIAVGLVMLVAHLVGRGTSSGFALIICGQVVAAVASSVVELARYYVVQTDTTGVKSAIIQSAQIGAISSISTPLDLVMVAVPVIAGVTVIIMLRRKLNLLAFNDEEARSMGIATETLRWVMILVCTFITAVVIAFCGNIAFVGFAIPLIVRRYIGPDFNYLIPASAVMGSLFMVVMYWFTELNIIAAFGIDFPVSVSMFTSILGAIMFVVVTLKQREANRSADWL